MATKEFKTNVFQNTVKNIQTSIANWLFKKNVANTTGNTKKCDKRKPSAVKQVTDEFPVLKSVMDELGFLQKVHAIYVDLNGKIRTPQIAKDTIASVSKECGISWCYVIDYVRLLLQASNPDVLADCYNKLNWEEICQKDNGTLKKIVKHINPKLIFKELFYLVAQNNDADTTDLLAEPLLDAYGWDEIIKELVIKYEEFLRIDELSVAQCENKDASKDTAPKKKRTARKPKKQEEKSADESKAHDISEPAKPAKRKLIRGRAVIQTFMDDNSEVEWKSPSEAEKGTSICHGSMNKCLNGGYKVIKDKNTGRPCTFRYKESKASSMAMAA